MKSEVKGTATSKRLGNTGLSVALVILRPHGHIAGLDASVGMEARFLRLSVRCVFTVLRCSGFQIRLMKLRRNKDESFSANLAVRACCQTDRHTGEYLYGSAHCYDCTKKYVHRHVRSIQAFCRWIETAGT